MNGVQKKVIMSNVVEPEEERKYNSTLLRFHFMTEGTTVKASLVVKSVYNNILCFKDQKCRLELGIKVETKRSFNYIFLVFKQLFFLPFQSCPL